MFEAYYTKDFDSVKHEELLKILGRRSFDFQDIKIIHHLYENKIAPIKLEDTESDAVSIKRGVRQVCVLQPKSAGAKPEPKQISSLNSIRNTNSPIPKI